MRMVEFAPVSFALFEPDIPQNSGNLFRTAACFGMQVHVIEPCGFAMSNSRMRRAGMDYMDHLNLTMHSSWEAFKAAKPPGRLVLMTTKGATTLFDFAFHPGDILLLGRESAGVPDTVHDASDARVFIPMAPGMRSINVAVSGGVAAFEALRQLQPAPGANTISGNG